MVRPCKLTPECQEKLLYAIGKGATYELACKYARIRAATLCNWRDRAENGEEPFFTLFEEIGAIEAEASFRWLDKIEEAAEAGTWQAASWKLERIHSKAYGPNAQLNEVNAKLDKLLSEKENQ
jgi:hypothetical protein